MVLKVCIVKVFFDNYNYRLRRLLLFLFLFVEISFNNNSKITSKRIHLISLQIIKNEICPNKRLSPTWPSVCSSRIGSWRGEFWDKFWKYFEIRDKMIRMMKWKKRLLQKSHFTFIFKRKLEKWKFILHFYSILKLWPISINFGFFMLQRFLPARDISCSNLQLAFKMEQNTVHCILNYKMKHKRGRECYIFVRAFRRNGPVWQHGIRTPRSSHCQTNSCPFWSSWSPFHCCQKAKANQ